MRRPRRTGRLYLVLSVALAVAAMVLAHGYLRTAAASARPTEPQVMVVAASEPIERGAVVAAGQLRLVGFPRRLAPPGAIEDVDKAAGRVALAGLAPGEVVTETRLSRVRAGPVASLVPRGLRAFAVPTWLPRGAVAPGDRVDVLATYGSGQPHTETAAESVEVLFVLGPSSSGSRGLDLDVGAAEATPATTLILLVDPAQQERLAFARAFANLEVSIAPAE